MGIPGQPLAALPVVAAGTPGADDTLTLALPELRPFARVVLVAEVRGVDERGIETAPGLWSPPSLPLELLVVPPEPVDAGLTATLAAGGGDLRLTAHAPGLLRPVPAGVRGDGVFRVPAAGPCEVSRGYA